jgi:hypothetical protein
MDDGSNLHAPGGGPGEQLGDLTGEAGALSSLLSPTSAAYWPGRWQR